MVFYSGHGGRDVDAEKPNGTWAPVADQDKWLKPDYIWRKLNELTQCENSKCSETRG